MAIAFLVVVVVEDILFSIFQWGVFLGGGILGVVLLLFLVYSRDSGRRMNEMSFNCRWENSSRDTREKLKENKLEFAFSIYVLV